MFFEKYLPWLSAILIFVKIEIGTFSYIYFPPLENSIINSEVSVLYSLLFTIQKLLVEAAYSA